MFPVVKFRTRDKRTGKIVDGVMVVPGETTEEPKAACTPCTSKAPAVPDLAEAIRASRNITLDVAITRDERVAQQLKVAAVAPSTQQVKDAAAIADAINKRGVPAPSMIDAVKKHREEK